MATESLPSPVSKFPHTRALLASILRDYTPTIKSNTSSSDTSDSDPEGDLKDDSVDLDQLAGKVIHLLEDDEEDDVKDLIKSSFGISDESVVDQYVLDLMHKRRDDLSNVPFLFLTPVKRPSRPPSRASIHSYRGSRPGTPTLAASSPLSLSFRRPSSPFITPSIAYSNGYGSPTSSPTPSPAIANSFGSQPSSPMDSPRFLNAKASEFRPTITRTGSSSSILSNHTPSPDLWAHNHIPSPTLSSASALGRTSSNLAIAAPLVPEQSPEGSHNGDTPSIRTPYNEDEDPFAPFIVKKPPIQSRISLARSLSDAETQWSASSNSNSSPSTSFDGPHPHVPGGENWTHPQQHSFDRPPFARIDSNSSFGPDQLYDSPDADMTPFDVLTSVFGTTVPSMVLEEALVHSGYEFEGAMAWLVERALPPPPASLAPPPPRMVNGVVIASRDAFGNSPSQARQGVAGRQSPRYGQGQKNVTGGNRVCRYFLAGECRRADCRFSHDIERALCRFWLRGQCAKGDQCEFLHNLPQHIDIPGLTAAMRRTDFGDESRGDHPIDIPPHNDFPALGHQDPRNRQSQMQLPVRPLDASRTRFASAVKKAAPLVVPGRADDHGNNTLRANVTATPRPSPRIKLRPPSLLPTLPTGDTLNKLYMRYRSRAIELGVARNACLTKAAEAWRRGDGASAKRFSREAHDLNNKMGGETAEAALGLVRERARVAVQAVRTRDKAWTDDPGDQAMRGKQCGAGLGVCLGIARKNVEGDRYLSPEERTESLLDLHGLHSGEAVEVVQEFLMGLESEHYFGLAYLIVGEEKHTGTQDTGRGASSGRLATGVRDWVFKWGYPWSERDGIICVDPLTHS